MIDADKLSAEELAGLDAYEQLRILNDIFRDVKLIADEQKRENNRVTDAKIALLSAAGDSIVQHKRDVLDGQRNLKNAGYLMAARKLQASILQTQMRLPGAV